MIDRRISLPPDSMLRPRNSLTVFEHLRSDVAPSGRPGLTPHGALLALGSIAAVRPDLAPEIERLVLSASLSDEYFETPGEPSILEHFLRGRPERAAAIAAEIIRQWPVSTSTEPLRVNSRLKPPQIRALAVAASVDRSLVPEVTPRLVALLRASGSFVDTTVATGLVDLIPADATMAPALVDVLAANTPPQSPNIGDLLAAVVVSGGAPAAHRLASTVLTWSLSPIVTYGTPSPRAALIAVIHAAPDTCEAMLGPIFTQLDQPSPSRSAQLALSEAANGDSHCADRAMDMLLSRARRASGQNRGHYCTGPARLPSCRRIRSPTPTGLPLRPTWRSATQRCGC